MNRVFFTIETACLEIFDRLQLDPSLPEYAAWSEQLRPALKDGLIVAEGRITEYRKPAFTPTFDRAFKYFEFFIESHEVIRRYPMDAVGRDWWLDASPCQLRGTLISLQRDTAEGLEVLDHIQIRAADIDRLWPTSVDDARAVNSSAASKTCHANQNAFLPRARGRRSTKRQAIIDLMRAKDLAWLQTAKEEEMAAEFGASRDTCRKARDAILLSETETSTITDK